LLGENVRYDAQVKHFPELNAFLQTHFELISVCPEVEIGLSVPRPPVQLVQSTSPDSSSHKIVGRDDPSIDITHDMQIYCQQRPAQLNSIHGYIFKSKSPSCGIRNVPLFNESGQQTGVTRGAFADAIVQLYPELPITDETRLSSLKTLEDFLQRTRDYQNSSPHAKP